MYIAPALTRAAAANLHRDSTFSAAIPGPTYAQPLFWAAQSSSDRDRLIVATEQDHVLALDPQGGGVLWDRPLGTPVPLANMPCGNIDPFGVTGTPILDVATRSVYVNGLTTPDGGQTKKHLVFALSIDDGSVRSGWPLDVSQTVRDGQTTFDSSVQGERGALALLGGTLYVPYGGLWGDCGSYHGWVVGIPTANPAGAQGVATRAVGGGIWGPSGIASDGSSLYVATGNTFGAATWMDGDAVLKLGPGPTYSQQPPDYFAPTNWPDLDANDVDLGGTGPILVHVPGATPSDLVVALGKDGNIYVLDRGNLGGVSAGVVVQHVSSDELINAAATYTTAQGSYVVFKGAGIGCPSGQSGNLTSVRIRPGAPPTVSVAWCADQQGNGSPMVTTSDGQSEAIVWSVGAESSNRLYGFNGDTGAMVFGGGGAAEAMGNVRRFQTPIVARGRIFVASDNQLYAFTIN
jgi:hypothetical protein